MARPAKWGFSPFLEAALTVAVEGEVTMRASARITSHGDRRLAPASRKGFRLGGLKAAAAVEQENRAGKENTEKEIRASKKRRGAGEMWLKPFNGCPADDRLRIRTLFPKACRLALAAREARASVSPTPFRRRPCRHPTDRIAILHFAISPDVAGLNATSPTGSERTLRDVVTSSSSRLPCASREPFSSRRSSPLPSSPLLPS
jgi:hypothetical protein